MFLFNCTSESTKPELYTLIIVDVYKDDGKVNDGKVAKHWYTVFKILETGSQDIESGKYGNIGDTLKNMINYSGYWRPKL
jgi:hypothetical protein